MPGFFVIPAGSVQPGALVDSLFRAANRVPFWGLNEKGFTCNEGPDYERDPWDTFYINDMQVPGKCWVEGKGIAQIEVEKKKGKGQAGAKVSLYGYLPDEFDMVCRIATPSQWDIFQAIEDKIWAGPTKETKPPSIAVKVKYPDLQRLRIYEAVLVGVPLAEQSDVEGAKHFRFRFHEQVKTTAYAVRSATAAVPPEDARQPASAALNATPPMPATVDANSSLDGPPLVSHPGVVQ